MSPMTIPRESLDGIDDDRKRPVPEVPVFDYATADPDDVVEGLIKAGGCVIRNTVSPEDLAKIEADTRPYLDADGPWKGSIFPSQTRRVKGLADKSKAFMDAIVKNPLYQAVSDIMLSSTITMWWGDKIRTSTSRPQLNNTIIFSIGPGAEHQGLHRDDIIHHHVLERMTAEQYKIGQDVGIGWFVAGKKTTKANGATRFIPGSHLWDQMTPSDNDLAFFAELEPGDAFIMLSSCYHGGSANTTTDEERLIYSCFMTKGFLRQEENQYLGCDKEKLKEMHDVETLKLIGYDYSRPFLGWTPTGHPLTAIFGGVDDGDKF